MTTQDIITLLDKTREETLAYFSLDEEKLALNYGEGKWSVRQILHHLTDTELLFMGRLKKIIAEPGEVIWAYDPDKWAAAFDYAHRPLDGNKVLYESCRAYNRALILAFVDVFGDREWIHSKTGLRTFRMECEKVAVHNEHHLGQIRQALGVERPTTG